MCVCDVQPETESLLHRGSAPGAHTHDCVEELKLEPYSTGARRLDRGLALSGALSSARSAGMESIQLSVMDSAEGTVVRPSTHLLHILATFACLHLEQCSCLATLL
jgi:hypothetical protein